MSSLIKVDTEYKNWITEISNRFRRTQMYPTAQNRQHTVDDFENIVNRQQAVDDLGQDIIFYIPWGHHVQILGKCKSNPQKALFYVKKTLENNWSRDVLLNEKELKDALINKAEKFLIELGTGFAYMGREVRIEVGETEKFIDMLFYNTKRHCYVVLEVKTGKFDSSYAGQLGTYVVAVNHQIKSEQDNPTVGLLICKDLDKVEAQYALESSSQPIGVSSYELSKLIPEEFKGSMPTIEEIEAEFGDIDY